MELQQQQGDVANLRDIIGRCRMEGREAEYFDRVVDGDCWTNADVAHLVRSLLETGLALWEQQASCIFAEGLAEKEDLDVEMVGEDEEEEERLCSGTNKRKRELVH